MIWSRRHVLGALGAAGVSTIIPARAAAFAQAAAGDAAILRTALETLHPGLYRYARPSEMAAAFSRFESEFGATDDLGARYLVLSRLLGRIRCGHTYANFFNQRRAVADALFAGRKRLPFRFRWLGSRMIVVDGLQTGLSRGTEVLRIDGRSAPEVLAALMPLTRADGSNNAKRRALLSVEGQQRIETFDVYHPLLFPPEDSRVALSVRTPQGALRAFRLERIDLATRQAAMLAPPATGADNPGWTLRHEGGAAVMTMPTWALYDSSWDWRAWIAAGFEEMASRRSTALILDLRANEGGNDIGNDIIARMIDAPLLLSRDERRVRFRQAPEALAPYLDTWDRSFDRLGETAEAIGDGFYRLPPTPGDDAIVAQAPRFRGRLITLVGPQNSSATFQFARLVREHRLGRLIGETTGGNRRGINGGAFYFLRLPDSGLEADIPLIGFYPTTPQPDAGIHPDDRVAATAEDIAAGRDPAMARALELAAA